MLLITSHNVRGKGENTDILSPTAELISGEDIHCEGHEAARQGDPLCLGMGMANSPLACASPHGEVSMECP